VAAILTVLRQFIHFAREQAAGHWDYRSTDVAGWAPASRRRMPRLIRDQIGRYMRGEPLENAISGAY
jgi:hypothetical protein